MKTVGNWFAIIFFVFATIFSIYTVEANAASTVVSINNSSCTHENVTWFKDRAGDKFGVQWNSGSNGCGWWVWVSGHCANPRLGTDQGWLQSGHVQSIGTYTGITCANPNVVIRGYLKWHHSSNSGTTYALRVIG